MQLEIALIFLWWTQIVLVTLGGNQIKISSGGCPTRFSSVIRLGEREEKEELSFTVSVPSNRGSL